MWGGRTTGQGLRGQSPGAREEGVRGGGGGPMIRGQGPEVKGQQHEAGPGVNVGQGSGSGD